MAHGSASTSRANRIHRHVPWHRYIRHHGPWLVRIILDLSSGFVKEEKRGKQLLILCVLEFE
jgi:hypothetical protein